MSGETGCTKGKLLHLRMTELDRLLMWPILAYHEYTRVLPADAVSIIRNQEATLKNDCSHDHLRREAIQQYSSFFPHSCLIMHALVIQMKALIKEESYNP